MAYLYVPGLAESRSDSESFLATDTEPFVMSRGKPMQRRSLERAWKTKPWMSRLSGLTLEPSTAARGVAKWILLLPDTLASRLALPADDVEPMIPDICGLMLGESLKRPKLLTASAKTLRGISVSDLSKYEPNYKIWATQCRGQCLARRKLARLIGVSGCSSWPTARGADSANAANTTAGRKPGHKYHDGDTLVDATRMWPTPRSSMNENRTTHPAPTHGKTHGRVLAGEAAQWATPTGRDHKDGACADANVPTNALLGRQALRTPMPGDTCSTDGQNLNLPWPSPRPSKTDKLECNTRNATGKGRKLNPLFVEWLMNFPSGWSDVNRATSTVIDGMSSTQMDATGTSVLAKKDCDSVSNITTGCKPTPCSTGLTDFAPSATPLCLWLQRWRSYIYGIASMLPPTIVPEVEE